MILTKGVTGSIPYMLPGGATPTSISYTTYDPEGTQVATGSISLPTSYTITAADGTYAQEAVLTAGATPSGIVVGGTVRITDTWGMTFDANCYGKLTKAIRVSDFGGTASEVATAYNPEIAIPVTSTVLDETGDGWKVALTWVSGGVTYTDTIYFSVCMVSLNLAISPREYLDAHPEAASDLAALERRRDWPRLVKAASAMVEDRLRSMDKWYSAVVSASGLRRATAEALAVILAPSSIPASQANSPGEWLGRIESRFNSVIAEVTASAYYDENQDGVIDESEKTAPANTSYKAL